MNRSYTEVYIVNLCLPELISTNKQTRLFASGLICELIALQKRRETWVRENLVQNLFFFSFLFFTFLELDGEEKTKLERNLTDTVQDSEGRAPYKQV